MPEAKVSVEGEDTCIQHSEFIVLNSNAAHCVIGLLRQVDRHSSIVSMLLSRTAPPAFLSLCWVKVSSHTERYFCNRYRLNFTS